uniref:Uncharacterized protein n=1 Tax=Arundo donax TaxID=35708 RepID=A0A0A8XQW9_ARUDO
MSKLCRSSGWMLWNKNYSYMNFALLLYTIPVWCSKIETCSTWC